MKGHDPSLRNSPHYVKRATFTKIYPHAKGTRKKLKEKLKVATTKCPLRERDKFSEK